MNNHDAIILKTIYSSIRPKAKYLTNINKYPNITNYLRNRYDYYDTIREVLDRLKYHLNIRPICEQCGKPVKYRCIYNGYPEYSRFCSIKCSNKHNHYIGEITKEKKYGDKNYCNPQKIAETKKERYGNPNYINKEKAKRTCLEKYGQTSFNKKKEIETCLKKYGVDNYMKTKYAKQYMSEKMSDFSTQQKRISTCKMNHSFSSSKPEEELYLYIKEKFPSVIRQYKDKERYLYNCDFYLPELDLFIEYQGTWAHGPHAYNENSKEDQILLNKWKANCNNKENSWYKRAIKGWTISDVNKRNKAKENNLNFYEFWNLNDAKKFINEI